MNAVLSRYQFHDHAQGFSIEGKDRSPVEVIFHPTMMEVIHDGLAPFRSRLRLGFFNFGKLLEFVARGLLRDWQPTERWYGARAWAEQQTARSIARRLRERWLQYVERMDPQVLAVQRAIFAATFSDAPLALDSELYRRDYLVHDVIQYPACAIAVRNAALLTSDLDSRRLRHSASARQLQQLATSMGLTLDLHVTSIQELTPNQQLDRLEDWKATFSDTGEAYRTLNRTLMNLPGRIPHRVACELRKVRLERPLERRLELLIVALYAGIRSDRDEIGRLRPNHGRLLQHAKPMQIRESLHRLSRHLRQPLDSRRAADVKQFVQFIADYPTEHEGNLIGLTERAIRWHRDQHEEQMNAMRQHYGAETPTMLPPISLPDHEDVRFLDTVSAICAEAEMMHHCVASYIDLAVQGNCYLFHVRYKGEDATVEVGCEGKVRQAQGPRNQQNGASKWGKRLLNRWAKSLPPGGYCGRRYAAAHDPEEIPF